MTDAVAGWLRLAGRIPLLLLHLLISLPLTLLAHLPGIRSIRWGGRPLYARWLSFWSAGILFIFGVRRRCDGEPTTGPALLAANHVSWMDIPLLHSVAPMSFVSKAEVGDVPLIGAIARVGGTLFHRRGSHRSAEDVTVAMLERLNSGHRVLIFPEGGILHGAGVKRFHARLFRVAVDGAAPVQPVAIRYLRSGEPYRAFEFKTGETVLANFFRLLKQPGCDADLTFCEPLPSDGAGRDHLARAAEGAVRSIVDAGARLR
ncbi:MAG: lysophospholipid acyltransferase family protein [Xanthomonadales bacterium]|nr:lysophospholipid acyltransferase family protein [Xanthomonadales bacterium]